MLQNEITHFPQEVKNKLKTYVYRLVDPRNGETFYVGKGTGNRVFSHAHLEKKIEGDALNNKTKQIREIINAGLDVIHIIHRHGMDEKTAEEVEAALIDAYPGLTNIQRGIRSSARGAMHAGQIQSLYSAQQADFKYFKIIIINIYRSIDERSLYDATRYAWKIDKSRAEKADFILGAAHGLIKCVFKKPIWLEATPENFPGFEGAEGRFGFIGGDEAPQEIKTLFIGKRIPEKYMKKKGAANPIQYTYK